MIAKTPSVAQMAPRVCGVSYYLNLVAYSRDRLVKTRVNMGITKGMLARTRIPAVLDDFWLGSWNLVFKKNVSTPGSPRGKSCQRGFYQTTFLTIVYYIHSQGFLQTKAHPSPHHNHRAIVKIFTIKRGAEQSVQNHDNTRKEIADVSYVRRKIHQFPIITHHQHIPSRLLDSHHQQALTN